MSERIEKFNDILQINVKLSIIVPRGDYEGTYDSRLEDFGEDGSLLIAMPSQGGIPVPLLPGTKLRANFLGPDSRYKFDTAVVGREMRGALYMLILKRPEYLKREQLRDFFRVPARIRGLLSVYNRQADSDKMPAFVAEYDCVVVDISGGGCRLLSDADVFKGQVLSLDISPVIGDGVILFGRVVRTMRLEGKYQISMAFTFSKEVERNPVIKYVMKRQLEIKQLKG